MSEIAEAEAVLSAETSQADSAAESAPETAGLAQSDVVADLTRFFEQEEGLNQEATARGGEEGLNQVDNQDDLPPPASETGENAPEPETDEDAAADTAADAEETEETAEVLEFPDEEALKRKFPRNSSRELIAEAARFSKLAEEGHQFREALGGKHYEPSMKKIAEGITQGDPTAVFEGLSMASDDAYANNLALALDIALVRAPELKNSEREAFRIFGETAAGLADTMLAHRFGEGMTAEAIDRLARFERDGWTEFLADAIENERVDYDRFNDLLERGAQSPELKAALKREADLKRQLEEKEKAQDEEKAQSERARLAGFDTLLDEAIEKVLDDVVLKSSVLKADTSDTPDLKAEKAMARKLFLSEIRAAFSANERRAALFEMYKSGAGATGKFADTLARALSEAALAAKPQTNTLERMIAKLYGAGRNSRLLEAKTNARNSESEKITAAGAADRRETRADRASTAVQNDGRDTDREVLKMLEGAFAQSGM